MFKKFNTSSLHFVAIAILTVSLITACKKEEETIAVIRVRDNQNQPVEKCMVVLFGKSTESKQASVNVYDTTFSDVFGDAKFNLSELYKSGQAGVAVLNIDARKGTAIGTGIIKIEEEKTSQATVFISQ